ncbi:MAG TPA: hypothetical protein VJ901_22085 [Thermoanaerobaculia bacterium]|nr:hypothetical protein [Thermoanaerobaculia bacterium]
MGIGAVWPVIYFFLFIGFMFFMFASMSTGHANQPFNGFWLIFPIHLLTMILMFVVIAMYVIHAFRTDRIPEDRRVLWVIVLLFGGLIAAPIYWYLYLWRPATYAPAGGAEYRP